MPKCSKRLFLTVCTTLRFCIVSEKMGAGPRVLLVGGGLTSAAMACRLFVVDFSFLLVLLKGLLTKGSAIFIFFTVRISPKKCESVNSNLIFLLKLSIQIILNIKMTKLYQGLDIDPHFLHDFNLDLKCF